MFFVFNKEKIYSYIIAVSTVIILFAVSTIYSEKDGTIEVSTNIVNQNVNNNIINNETNNTK